LTLSIAAASAVPFELLFPRLSAKFRSDIVDAAAAATVTLASAFDSIAVVYNICEMTPELSIAF
jgi:hypothetical protein